MKVLDEEAVYGEEEVDEYSRNVFAWTHAISDFMFGIRMYDFCRGHCLEEEKGVSAGRNSRYPYD